MDLLIIRCRVFIKTLECLRFIFLAPQGALSTASDGGSKRGETLHILDLLDNCYKNFLQIKGGHRYNIYCYL